MKVVSMAHAVSKYVTVFAVCSLTLMQAYCTVQYLMPFEEKVVIEFILEMSDLGTHIRNNFIPLIALSVTRRRRKADRLV